LSPIADTIANTLANYFQALFLPRKTAKKQCPLKVLPSLGSSQFPQLYVIMVFEVGTPVADAPVTD
jgi:hypothetical protein